MASLRDADMFASSSVTGETSLHPQPPPSSPWSSSLIPRSKRRRRDVTRLGEETTGPSYLSSPSSSRTAGRSARRTFLAALVLTLSLGHAAAEAQPSQDVRTSPTPHSRASQPLTSSSDEGLQLNAERDSTHRFHPAKIHGTLQYSSISNGPDASVKATSILSAPVASNTSAAVFTFANSRHQYNSKNSNTNARARGSGGSQSPGTPSATEQQPPNRLAFAYLEDMGLKNRLPFKSSMPRAGESWNEAGLRPNVDPRLPSIYRNERGESREFGKGKEREEDGLAEEEEVWGSEPREKAQDWAQASQKGLQQYQQLQGDSPARPPTDPAGKVSYGLVASSQGSNRQHSDGEAAVAADASSAAKGGSQAPDSDLLDSLSAVTDSVASGGTAGASSITPEVLRWSSLLINSGRMMLSWIKRAQKDEHGIALTMLMPKVSKPVVARRPWIPNDSKRDLILLIIATMAVCGALCILWSSRVSPEEFERARRHKEFAADAAAKDEADIIYEEPDENLPTGLSSSSRPAPGYSRSRAGGSTMSRRPRMAEDTQTGVQSEDSDAEYLHLTLDRRNGASIPSRGPRRGSLLGPTANLASSTSRAGDEGLISSWLTPLYRWYRRRDSNPEVVLPLSSDLSRSSTPNPLLQASVPGSDTTLSAMGAGRRSRSNSITRKWKLQAPNLPRQQSSVNLLPASMDSRTSSSSSLQSLAQIVPFRSITPQPATSRQREREREKRRMTMLEVGRRDSAASAASSRAGYETLDKMENGKGDYALYDGQDDASGSSSASGSVSGDEPGTLRRPASFTTHGAWTEALPLVDSGAGGGAGAGAGAIPSLLISSSSSSGSSSSSSATGPPHALLPNGHGHDGHGQARLAPPTPTPTFNLDSSSPRIGSSGESTPRASDLQGGSGDDAGGSTYFVHSHTHPQPNGLRHGHGNRDGRRQGSPYPHLQGRGRDDSTDRSAGDGDARAGEESDGEPDADADEARASSRPSIPRSRTRAADAVDPLQATRKVREPDREGEVPRGGASGSGKGKERQLDRP